MTEVAVGDEVALIPDAENLKVLRERWRLPGNRSRTATAAGSGVSRS